jgi:ferritin-like metal-binding protein YciE
LRTDSGHHFLIRLFFNQKNVFMAIEVIVKEKDLAHSKLKELLVDQLYDINWAEKKLVKALDKMYDAATTLQLKDAFRGHQTETRAQITRLERVFELIGVDADTSKCPAMAGIIDEAHDIIDETDEGTAQRDAGLVIAAQKAEHYEIATYGSLAQLAETLGYTEAKELLGLTLEEEKAADALLTQIAETGINYIAALEEENDDSVI